MNSDLYLYRARLRKEKHQEYLRLQRLRKQKEREEKRLHTQKAIETALKIAVNVTITLVAGLSIKQMLPYHLTQQARLREIEAEIALIKPRVEKLEEEFAETFDPKLARKIIEKNSYKVEPDSRPVFFLNQNK
ncbi:MAG: hypothetical protein NZ901_01250 [Geminocystis sp.]|nr:hypothetical protein [Geminocystis sp.]HIK36714.1 hypothetical protein [Geminocystis sp. M7585_C2015_104]MCS7146794.1 hypothetical protein [Geminocystis sp.]MCX8077056.1 hypothetical protein [Geminocystis sp.]MDW8115620.1 hypothetical protein [Geminocystis sp.]